MTVSELDEAVDAFRPYAQGAAAALGGGDLEADALCAAFKAGYSAATSLRSGL